MLYIPDKKHNYKDDGIDLFPSPTELNMPLLGFRSKLEVMVKKGERVLQDQLLASSAGIFGGNIHAPVSGLVGDQITVEGDPYLQIFNDFVYQQLAAEKIEHKNVSISDFIRMLQHYGIEGSGGARFPTAAKYDVAEGQIDTLIINGAECEPYLSADYALMKSFGNELAETISFIQGLYKIRAVVMGIERQHKSLKPIIERAFDKFGVVGHVKLLPDFYPQGGELQLIKSATGRELRKGTIPSKEGILVNNVATIYAVFNALFNGKPYTHRVMTVFDEESNKGRNFWMPVGTTVNVISEYFFSQHVSATSIILGGTMMGKAVTDLRTAIHKGSGGLIRAFKRLSKAENCIGCGYCVDVCPQNLLPLEFSKNLRLGNIDKLRTFHLQDCIECGACAYVCPSEIALVQDIRSGKKIMI